MLIRLFHPTTNDVIVGHVSDDLVPGLGTARHFGASVNLRSLRPQDLLALLTVVATWNTGTGHWELAVRGQPFRIPVASDDLESFLDNVPAMGRPPARPPRQRPDQDL